MINFELKETVRGISYSVRIFSPDGQKFTVTENNQRETYYPTREAFLEDFQELESWFWGEED